MPRPLGLGDCSEIGKMGLRTQTTPLDRLGRSDRDLGTARANQAYSSAMSYEPERTPIRAVSVTTLRIDFVRLYPRIVR